MHHSVKKPSVRNQEKLLQENSCYFQRGDRGNWGYGFYDEQRVIMDTREIMVCQFWEDDESQSESEVTPESLLSSVL